MTDITAVKRALHGKAQSVAMMLLPNGRKDGQEWRVGSVAGEAGNSMGVHLTGEKAGIWADFHSGETGDLLDLWCAVKRMSLSEALTDAKGWLGMSDPEPYREPKRVYSKPKTPKCGEPEGRALDYLTEDRNLPQEIIDLYKIRANGDTIIFPFLKPDGTLALVKTRQAGPDGFFRPTEADCEPILGGWHTIPEDAREVTITEGEFDAPSMRCYGYPAMTVPFGGGKGAKQQWIENDFERLERFEKIYLALDMDEPGDQACEEIAARLGRHRCVRVKLPRKDANECRVDGISQEDMDKAMANAAGMDPEGLRRAKDYTDKVTRLFWPTDDEPEGYVLPYAKIGKKFCIRPGEMTLWSGDTGDGKSQILSDCAVDWVRQRSRICIASLEMSGAQTLKRMVKQAGGVERPAADFIQTILEWLDQGLLIYEHVGKAGVEALLEVFDYARAKYGCDQFIADSLMRLGVASDDYVGQEKAVFQIVDWAIKRGVHVHLVAHARKAERQRGAPSTMDVKGASEITSNAHNIITVWRNRKLEEDIKAAESDDERFELEQKPGVILTMAKQRNGDWEGKVGLWFDQDTYRYRSSHDGGQFARQYVRMRKGEQAA